MTVPYQDSSDNSSLLLMNGGTFDDTNFTIGMWSGETRTKCPFQEHVDISPRENSLDEAKLGLEEKGEKVQLSLKSRDLKKQKARLDIYQNEKTNAEKHSFQWKKRTRKRMQKNTASNERKGWETTAIC